VPTRSTGRGRRKGGRQVPPTTDDADDEDEDGDAVQAEEIPSKQAVAAGGGAAAAASEEALAAASMAPCTPLWRSGTDSEPEPGGAAEVGLPPPPVGELRTDAPATVALLRPALLLLHLGEAVAAPPPQEGEADPNRSAVAAAAPVVVAGGGDCWEGPRNADTPSNAEMLTEVDADGEGDDVERREVAVPPRDQRWHGEAAVELRRWKEALPTALPPRPP